MKFRYYIDIETGYPHIVKHDVSQQEIVDFFAKIKYFRYKRADNSFEAFGRLKSGRFLKVAYREISKDELFIITAYDIEDKIMIHLIEDNL